MSQTKAELRQKLKAQRAALDSTKYQELSRIIIKKCSKIIPWQTTKKIHMYLPVQERREVDTWSLLELAFEKGLMAVVPVMYEGEMLAMPVKPETTWRKNQLGIPEPVATKPLGSDARFDVIIVPMLGFDRARHRIGNGGGHYDRFLASQAGAMKIGLSYEDCCCGDEFQHEPHDIALDYVVTEAGVISG